MGNLLTVLKIRAGADILSVIVNNYIEINYPNYVVGKGMRYINNDRLRQIVNSLFKAKAKNGVIFIRKTALCHLAQTYGLDLPSLPIPIHDFVKLSSWYQLIRKIFSVAYVTISPKTYIYSLKYC
jgi:hypothetical protein